jgi:hypothetical protein
MISRAKKAFLEQRFLDEFVPVPEELKNPESSSYGGDNAVEKDNLREQLQKKHGYSSWYDYCISEWGTKWDVGDEHGIIAESKHELIMSFDSAWSPPTDAYNKMLDLGFDIVAHYYEPGVAFVGKYDNGYDDAYDITGETSATVRDSIGEELDDMWGISESMAEYEQDQKDEVVVWYEQGVEELKLENK